MSSDIYERLRWDAALSDIRKYSELLTEAANEIERLRSLITAWSETEDSLEGYTEENVDPAVAKAYYAAWVALRNVTQEPAAR
jgi:hypothetical protein